MLLSFPLTLLYASTATASTLHGHYSGIQKRDGDVCTDLSVSSNNGDRKVAIVIDSSGSMATNDPYDLRINAGRALNEFLIANGEATGDQKPDLVTVIDFDYVATLDYPLGDPGGANASFSKVDALGGTYIAAGVNMAIDELTGGGGPTEKRSAIVIFTDGEVRLPDALLSRYISLSNMMGRMYTRTNWSMPSTMRRRRGFVSPSASWTRRLPFSRQKFSPL
jgi:hypothetical protein